MLMPWRLAGCRFACAQPRGRMWMLVLIALGWLTAAGWTPQAHAVSCTTQSQMGAAERTELATAVNRIAGLVVADNTAALKQATLPSVQAQFDGIASTVDGLGSALKGATIAVENLYALQAQDLKATDEEAQFFCSAPGASLLVTVTIPQLPPGRYALALVHAEGVAKPQQFGMILARGADTAGAAWDLAGFFVRPLQMAGHDEVWYWTHARELAKAQERWGAYLYYQTARFLATPVDLISSPNLTKLDQETAAAKPESMPGEGTPTTTVAAGDQSFALTSVKTDDSLGGLDVVLHYNANAGAVDPVFARAQALQLMQATLKQHPELRANFHGLWVYADSPGHQPFAVELPMAQIQ